MQKTYVGDAKNIKGFDNAVLGENQYQWMPKFLNRLANYIILYIGVAQ